MVLFDKIILQKNYIMKKIFFPTLLVFTFLFFQSCEEDNELIFTAVPNADGIAFSNTFSDEYLLSEDTENNVGERFVWNTADFDAPTNVSYDLQASTSQAFDMFDLLGTTTETNFAITVGQLLDYAEILGLDNDPNTNDVDGNPNDVGAVYFRVRAYVGAGTGNNTEMISAVSTMNIRWLEMADPGGACDPVFGLGDALVDAQWDWSTAAVFGCTDDVFEAKVNLTTGTFRFFSIQDDWASGLSYQYYVDEGYTIDANFENAADADNNFSFIGTPGIFTLTIDENNKTITLVESSPLWMVGAATPGGWDFAGATVALEISPDVWEANLDFTNETFRFFTIDGDWGSGLNYPYYEDAGYTIDANFENANDGDLNFNFVGTPGNYTITVDGILKTISLN